MARRAGRNLAAVGHQLVRIGQRETGVGVVEGRSPRSRSVACGAE
jgi:hypothetical protein